MLQTTPYILIRLKFSEIIYPLFIQSEKYIFVVAIVRDVEIRIDGVRGKEFIKKETLHLVYSRVLHFCRLSIRF